MDCNNNWFTVSRLQRGWLPLTRLVTLAEFVARKWKHVEIHPVKDDFFLEKVSTFMDPLYIQSYKSYIHLSSFIWIISERCGMSELDKLVTIRGIQKVCSHDPQHFLVIYPQVLDGSGSTSFLHRRQTPLFAS